MVAAVIPKVCAVNSVKSLKFSISNILSPEFGKNVTQPSPPSPSPSSSSSSFSSVSSSLVATISAATTTKITKTSIQTTTTTEIQPLSPTSSSPPSPSPSSSSTNNNNNSKCKKRPLTDDDDYSQQLCKKTRVIEMPAWVYCTRYSDRPSSGPRSRKSRKKDKKVDEKRPRTAFTADQLARLKQEFLNNRYLTEKRRQDLARDLKLNESQIKIWFQNKRAKIKKSTGSRNPLALHLMAQGLYNHSTMKREDGDYEDYDDDDDDDDEG